MPPVLLHIGYHKTGSRWLRFLFFGNPQTGFGWVDKTGPEHPVRRLVGARPLEFDAEQSRAEFEPLVQKLVDEGLSPVVSFERFSGNPFSGGYDSKEIADRLAQVFPDARVLVVVREQRSMIVSTLQAVRARGRSAVGAEVHVPPTSQEHARTVVRLAAFRVRPPARLLPEAVRSRRPVLARDLRTVRR